MPALLLGVVMIAGAFAFMPVQEASTVHLSAASTENSIRYITLTDVCTAAGAANTECDNITADVATGVVYEIVTMRTTAVFAAAETLDYAACTANTVVTDANVGANTGGAGTVIAVDVTTSATPIVSIGIAGNDIVCTDGGAASTVFTAGDTITTVMVLKINADAADPTIDNS